MGAHRTGAATMGGVPTWIPFTCPVCGGLRDGEDGPPWPFHAKGFHACECEDDDQPRSAHPTDVLTDGAVQDGAAGPS
jgi:hypothetical protein